MTMLGLMLLVTVMTMLISGMAEGRRRSLGAPGTRTQVSGQQFHPVPYGFARTPWGLPTDVPLTEVSRQAIDSDITQFGIELRELDFDVVGYELTDDARGDYTLALDAYENAKLSLQRARADSEATHITHILEGGRYAMACVRARAVGKPLPMKRPPCFFDPAHGPSVEEVAWAPTGGAERPVPACAVDVARIRLGADPRIRMVTNGNTSVPYWEDRSQAAWARGYYGPWMHDPSVQRMTQGALMIGGFSLLMGLLDD